MPPGGSKFEEFKLKAVHEDPALLMVHTFPHSYVKEDSNLEKMLYLGHCEPIRNWLMIVHQFPQVCEDLVNLLEGIREKVTNHI